MGTPGVPLDISRDSIVNALKQTKGQVRKACQLLNCTHPALYKKINADPELQQIIAELRHETDDRFLDMAEDGIEHLMTLQDSNIDKFSMATFYILNNRGRKRGWVPPTVAAAMDSNDSKSQELALMLKQQTRFAEWLAKENASQRVSQASPGLPQEEINISQPDDQSHS